MLFLNIVFLLLTLFLIASVIYYYYFSSNSIRYDRLSTVVIDNDEQEYNFNFDYRIIWNRYQTFFRTQKQLLLLLFVEVVYSSRVIYRNHCHTCHTICFSVSPTLTFIQCYRRRPDSITMVLSFMCRA